MRLPREWIGPIEELVPFGPSAESVSSSPGSFVSPRGPDAEVIPGADEFWSEDSAAVQAVVQAPAGGAYDQPPRHRGGRRGLRRPRLARLAVWRGGREFPGHGHGRAMAALGLLTSIALIVAITETGPPTQRQRNGTRAEVTLPASISAPASKPPRRLARTRHTAAHASRRRPQPTRRAETRRTVRRVGHPEPHPSAPSQGDVAASYSPAPSRTAPVQGASSAPAVTVASSEQNVGASAAVRSSAQNVAHQGSAPSGPSGPVSLIGPGTSPSG